MQPEYCTSCGARLRKADVFCPRCGRRIKEEDSLDRALSIVNQKPVPEERKKRKPTGEKKQKKKKKRTGTVVVICIIALVGGVFEGYLITSDEVGNQFRMLKSYHEGKQMYDAQDYEQALKKMKQVKENSLLYRQAEAYQDNCYLEMARQYFEAEELEECISVLDKIKPESRIHPEAQKLTANANLALGEKKYEEKEYDQAMIYFESITQEQEDYSQAKARIDSIQSYYMTQGKRAYSSERYSDAKNWLEKIRESSDQYSEAQTILAKIDQAQTQKEQEEQEEQGIGTTISKWKEDIKGKKLMKTGVLISNKTALYYSPDESGRRAGNYKNTSKYKVYDYQVTPDGVLWVQTLLEEGGEQYVWSMVE